MPQQQCLYTKCDRPQTRDLGLCVKHDFQARQILAGKITADIPCEGCDNTASVYTGRCEQCAKKVPCVECGALRHRQAKSGLCKPCYQASLPPKPPCMDCGFTSWAKGLCQSCYGKRRYRQRRRELMTA